MSSLEFDKGVAEGRKQLRDELDACDKRNSELRELLSNYTCTEVEVVDDITGFTGIITRVRDYADGSIKGYVKQKGKAEGIWFELDRLKEVK